MDAKKNGRIKTEIDDKKIRISTTFEETQRHMHVTIIYRRFDNYGVDYREILRLDNLGYIKKDIASSIHSFRNTVSEILTLAVR